MGVVLQSLTCSLRNTPTPIFVQASRFPKKLGNCYVTVLLREGIIWKEHVCDWKKYPFPQQRLLLNELPQCFAGFEAREADFVDFDVNLGMRIDTVAGLAKAHIEGSETSNRYFFVLFECSGNQIYEGVDAGRRLTFGETSLFSNRRNQFNFVHKLVSKGRLVDLFVVTVTESPEMFNALGSFRCEVDFGINRSQFAFSFG